jgi:hypothetical protein
VLGSNAVDGASNDADDSEDGALEAAFEGLDQDNQEEYKDVRLKIRTGRRLAKLGAALQRAASLRRGRGKGKAKGRGKGRKRVSTSGATCASRRRRLNARTSIPPPAAWPPIALRVLNTRLGRSTSPRALCHSVPGGRAGHRRRLLQTLTSTSAKQSSALARASAVDNLLRRGCMATQSLFEWVCVWLGGCAYMGLLRGFTCLYVFLTLSVRSMLLCESRRRPPSWGEANCYVHISFCK